MPNDRAGNRRPKSYDSTMCPVGLYTGVLEFLAAVALLEKEFTWLGLGNT